MDGWVEEEQFFDIFPQVQKHKSPIFSSHLIPYHLLKLKIE